MSPTRRITIATDIQFRDPLPHQVDVVVIGGGVIGVFTALNLAEAGRRVLLCEKGRIAGEQSSRNWGWIRQQGRDEDELPIAMQSVQLWKEIDSKLHGSCGVRENGVAYLTTTKSELVRFEAWVETARRHGLHSEMMTPAQIRGCFSGQSDGKWIGGVTTPSDCKGEPWQAVPAVAKYANSLGVAMIENCAARRLDIQAGKVAGVVTELGQVACDQVVLAGGAWSRLFLGAHGVQIPQLSVLATAARTGPLPDFAKMNSVDEKLAIRRQSEALVAGSAPPVAAYIVVVCIPQRVPRWLADPTQLDG
jgi:glycine/D-amino acid oxidase-like deaminating enzyme